MATEKSAAEMAVDLEESLESGESIKKVLLDDEHAEGTAAGDGSDDPEPEVDDKPAAKAEKADDEPAKKAAAEEGPVEGGGGKTIPYSVLKATRERAHQLETELADAQVKLKAATTAPAKTEAATQQEDTAEDGLEDLPEALVKTIRGLKAELNDAKKKLTDIEQNNQKTATQAASTAAEVVQRDIDAVPGLADWQAEGGDKWKSALEIDARLMQNPAWKDKPQVERFAKVAKLVRAEFDIADPAPEVAVAKNGTTKPAAARAAVTSISDLSGGGNAPVDARDNLENSSAAALAVQMSSMSRDDIHRLLRETG